MISVVIPARNEEKFIGACLESVRAQVVGDAVECIVVDNGSTDETAAIAFKNGARVIAEKSRGVGAARRTGTVNARGEMVVHIDADTRLPPDYLSRVKNILETQPHISMVGGAFTFYDAPRWKNLLVPILGRPIYYISYLATGGRVGPMGNNMAFRAADYQKTDGFDAHLQFGEDMDLAIKLSKCGRVVRDHSLSVGTSARHYQVDRVLLRYGFNLFWFLCTRRPWKNEFPAD